MKILLTTSALALCLATSAFASPIIGSDSHDTNIANTPVASANSDASAAALAGAVSGSVSGANAVNTAITGPATATNTSVNSLNGGDNRATVGNVSSSSGPSTSNASLGSLNKFGGDASVVAGQDQHQSTATTTSTSTQQAQTLNDASVHTQATTATTGASTSSASGNGAGQTTSITTNYEAADIPKPATNTAYAAPAVVGGGVCAYTPFSAGLSLRIVSGSASGAIIDKGCESRANADVLARLGYTAQAVALLMQNEAVAQAFRTVGDIKPVAQAESTTPVQVAQATVTVLPVMPSNPTRGTMLPIPGPDGH